MGNTVYKLKPFKYYETLFLESWLSDKAKKGLKLKSIGPFLCSFEKGEPDTTAYRVHISKDKEEINSEETKAYRDHGWTPFTSFRNLHVFTAPSEYVATEVIQNGEAYVKMLRNFKLSTIPSILYCLFLVALYIFDLKLRYIGFSIGLAKVNLIYLTPLFLIFYIILYNIYQYIKSVCYKKRFNDKFILSHHLPWKKNMYFNLLEDFIFIFGLAFFVVISGLYDTNPKYISEVTETMPIISPINTEPTSTLHNEEIAIEEDETIFSSKAYEGRYSAYVPANYDGKNSKGYDVIIITEAYALKDDFLINGVVKDLAKKYFHLNKNPIDIFKVDSSSFDTLYIDEYMSGCKAVAVKNNTVVYVNYYGPQNKTQVLDALSKKLNSIQGGKEN